MRKSDVIRLVSLGVALVLLTWITTAVLVTRGWVVPVGQHQPVQNVE